MSIFKKAPPEPLDVRLAAASILPDNAYSRKQLTRAQDAIREALSGVDGIAVIGIDVTVSRIIIITDSQLLSFNNGRFERQAQLAEISDIALSQWGTNVQVTGKPNLQITLGTFEEANSFAIAADHRDIPKLFPAFFQQLLVATDHPITSTNMGRLIERVARMIIAGGAHAYFTQTQDESARQRFDQRFRGDLPPELILSCCDDMIDWLWNWNANCHDAIRNLILEIDELLTCEESPLRTQEDELEPLKW